MFFLNVSRRAFQHGQRVLAARSATTPLVPFPTSIYRGKSTALFSPTPRKPGAPAVTLNVANAEVIAVSVPKPPKAKKGKKGSTSKATIAAPEIKPPTGCWVDASPTHIAILIGCKYKVFTLKKGWKKEKRDVNWAETVAFELLAQVLIAQGQAGLVQVNSDSQTALHAIAGRKNRIPEIMSSAQRLDSVLKASSFKLKGVKVPRKQNPADPFSKGRITEGYEEIQEAIVIPEALTRFVAAD